METETLHGGTPDVAFDSGVSDIKVSTPGGEITLDYTKLYAAIARATSIPQQIIMSTPMGPSANNRVYSQQSINRAMRASKFNLNSIYGAFGNSFGTSIYPYYPVVNEGYLINSKTSVVKYITKKWAEDNMEEYIDCYSDSRVFERRIQAEEYLLTGIIHQKKSILKDLEKQKSYNPNTRKSKFKFEGYNGEQAKRTRENKKKAVVAQLEKLEYELENIEDLHPEWLI